MKVPPAGITPEAWQEAIRAGFHATPEASRREVEEILAAALPVLGILPVPTLPVQTASLTESLADSLEESLAS